MVSPIKNSITTHERASEIGRLGGLQKSERKKWKQQKYCNDRCAYHNKCPAISTSLSLDIADFEWKDNRWIRLDQPRQKINTRTRTDIISDRIYYPCYLKTQSIEHQHDFCNIFADGEDGIISIILDLYFRYVAGSRGTIKRKELRDLIETSLSVKKALYGEKTISEISGKLEAEIKTLNINVEVKKYINALNQIPEMVLEVTNEEPESNEQEPDV